MHTWHCPFITGFKPFDRTTLRYNLLRRLARALEAREVTLLGFGLGPEELRFVTSGDPEAVKRALIGVKSATVREAGRVGLGIEWRKARPELVPEGELDEALAWAHGVVACPPLAWPWSSHRDLLGYRVADFFDARPAQAAADPARVHELAGGGELPPAEAGADEVEEADLRQIMRVAAATMGVLPADRRSFRLFVHAARSLGYQTRDLADALELSRRRVRQLAEGEEPLVPRALRHLADVRLSAVP